MAKPFETITPHEKLTEAELEAYNLLVPKHKEQAIDMSVFSYKDVDDNKAELAKLDGIFAELAKNEPWKIDKKKRSQLFEAILANQIELSDWFGPEASTIVPSHWDDVKNGIDEIVEFESEEGFSKHLGLSIDATTNIPDIAKKIEQIRRDIQHGHLSKIKYFISESRGYKGELNDIPKVIVATGPATVRELASLWLNLEKLKQKKILWSKELNDDNPEMLKLKTQIRTLQKSLAEHRVQFQILWEIKHQLEYFIKLAEAQRQDAIVDKYHATLETINQILNKKSITISEADQRLIEQEPQYKAIIDEIS